MGATKFDHYSQKQIRNSELGRAIAAPARIVILGLLENQELINLPSLKKILRLDVSTIQQHMSTLVLFGLVRGRYVGKTYVWELNPETEHDFQKIKWALNKES